jgi:hypothetical protein
MCLGGVMQRSWQKLRMTCAHTVLAGSWLCLASCNLACQVAGVWCARRLAAQDMCAHSPLQFVAQSGQCLPCWV